MSLGKILFYFILLIFSRNLVYSDLKELSKEIARYKYYLLIKNEPLSNFSLSNDYLLVGKPENVKVFTNDSNEFTMEVLCRNQEILNFNPQNIELPMRVKDNDLYFVYSYSYPPDAVTPVILDSIRRIQYYKPYVIVIANIEWLDRNVNNYKSILYIKNKYIQTETNIILIRE